MKHGASGLIKQIIATLNSMAKSKAMALKTKTNAIRARLIIFSLLRNKKFLMSSLSHKLQSALGHHSYLKEESLLEDEEKENEQSNAIVICNDNDYSCESLPNPSQTQFVEEKDENCGFGGCYYRYEGGGDVYDDVDEKYPDLTHCLFDSELDFDGSVIDKVKNSKEEAGQEFKLEDEIDHVADLFIKRFRRQMILQKQDSIKRHQEIEMRGA